MSWTDSVAVENIMKLRREFHLDIAIETGTFKGVNAELYSLLFPRVLTCEIKQEYFKLAQKRLSSCHNVETYLASSPEFLASLPHNLRCFIYLDAHFYDPENATKWVVVEELKAMKKWDYCVLCVHDFDNGMGHLIYDGEHLDFKLIGKYLKDVNPHFHYYTNTECNPFTEESIKHLPITIDEDVLDAIRFVHSTPERKNRGMLFATPWSIELERYKLKEIYP